jgi:hypothetical protein
MDLQKIRKKLVSRLGKGFRQKSLLVVACFLLVAYLAYS